MLSRGGTRFTMNRSVRWNGVYLNEPMGIKKKSVECATATSAATPKRVGN